ncbi:MAG TPA: DUF1269 domain-containing protein [Streptosporangiaceae bacterium]|nr:DUF1269 domain-containing protein [Streptosporangiaceae bacterium]
MSTTAWRFRSTEGADDAVLRLKQLDSQDLIDVQDVAVVRWPQYASAPSAHEHVTDEGSKMTTMVSKLRGVGRIDTRMLDAVKADMLPGTSAVVVMSYGAVIDVVAKAFRGQPMELMRSDLSVQEQDQLRATFGEPGAPGAPPQ